MNPRTYCRGLAASLIALFVFLSGDTRTDAQAPFGLTVRLAATAQDATQAAGVDVRMASPWIRWTTLPEIAVTAELWRGGERVATTTSESDGTGNVVLGLFGPMGPARVQGGDELLVRAGEGEVELRLTAPDLVADVDVLRGRVVGRAPADSSLTLALWRAGALVSEDPVLTRTLTTDGSGLIDVDLSNVGLRPGDAGHLIVRDEDGHRFVAGFTALGIEVQLGNTFLTASATQGTTVTLAIEPSPDGAAPIQRRLEAGLPFDQAPVASRVSIGLQRGEGAPSPLAPGDRLRVSRTGGLVTYVTQRISLPAMEINIVSRDGHVRGTGPVSSSLELVLNGPLGELVRSTVETDATGTFDTVVDAEPGPGWQATLLWEQGIFRVLRFGVVPQVQVRVHTSSVRGLNRPQAPVSATLHSGGSHIGTWSTVADSQGRWQLQLRDESGQGVGDEPGPAHRVRPGDVLEIDLAGGDPINLVVPPMSARSDADAETVSGAVPPGTRLQLTIDGGLDGTPGSELEPVQNPGGPALVVKLDAGTDGRYVADLGAQSGPDGQPIDLEPPMFGSLVITRDDGHQFLLRWAPLSVQVRLDGGVLSGSGPGGRRVLVELRAADGTVLGRQGQGDLFGDNSDSAQWFAVLQDALGQLVTPVSGDTLHVTVGDDAAVLTVPPLGGVLHVADDLISGQGLAGNRLRLQTYSPLGEQVQMSQDLAADGTFRFDLGAQEVDIAYNWIAELTMDLGRHSAARVIRAPGLSVNLDTGEVFGSAEAGRAVRLYVTRAGRVLAEERFRAPANGAFSLALLDAMRAPLPLLAGDELILDVPEAVTNDRSVRMVIPPLTIDPEVGTADVSGRSPSDGRLRVYAGSVYPAPDPASAGGEVAVVVNGDNTWSGSVDNPAFATRAGSRFEALLQLASGHQVFRTKVMPVLNVQFGGAAVCGYADAAAAVGITLSPVGGGGAAIAATDGRFALALADSEGQPRVTAPGDIVRGDLGGEAASLRLPTVPVTLFVDWETWTISGTGPANRSFLVALPGRSCYRADDLLGGFSGPSVSGQVAEDGTFSVEVPPWFREFIDSVGRGVEISFTEQSGHRFYVNRLPVRAEVHVGTARVAGAATPLATLSMRLQAQDGAAKGSASVSVDTFGAFEARLVDSGGAEVRIAAGDTLIIGEGPAAARILVRPLAFDFSAQGGLAGTATPGETVDVTLRLRSSPERFRTAVQLSLVADENGRFGIETVPPRSDWSLDDVVSVRLTVPVDGVHLLVTELVLAPPDPEPVDGAIFLPWSTR